MLARTCRSCFANTHHRLEDEPDTGINDTDDTDAALTAAHRHAAHRHAAQIAGRNATRRADALFEMVTDRAADTLQPLPDHDGRGRAGRPSVLVVAPIDSLVDGTTPAWLLSPLAGRVKVTSATFVSVDGLRGRYPSGRDR